MDSGPAPRGASRNDGGEIIVNAARSLTKSPPGPRLALFRGHLSRPACSHVKKLAKQAGDPMRSRPNALFRPVFYGLLSGGCEPSGRRSVMNVQSFPGAALHSEERAHEADHPSSLLAK